MVQLRFTGDLLMEMGAGIELAIAAVPHLFLPLACVANVAKVGFISGHLEIVLVQDNNKSHLVPFFCCRMLQLLLQHQHALQFIKPMQKERILEM